MRAVRRHTDCAWVLLYIESGSRRPWICRMGVVKPEKGTRRGPSLVRCWLICFFIMRSIDGCKTIPTCRSSVMPMTYLSLQQRSASVVSAASAGSAACGLQAGSAPEKTKIVYCKDQNRLDYPIVVSISGLHVSTPKVDKSDGKLSVGFSPAISDKAPERCAKQCVAGSCVVAAILPWRKLPGGLVRCFLAGSTIMGVFTVPALRGALRMLRTLDSFIVRWAQRKYRQPRGHTKRAWDWLRGIQSRQPNLFAHWPKESPVGRWEPYKSRGSRPVLGGRGGAIPPRYSTISKPTTTSVSREPPSAAI